MQNLCQINYTHLFCGRDNVAMKVFAFEDRETVNNNKKSLKMRLLTKKMQETIVKDLSNKKKD